jgi:hypothetical protein
MAWYGMKRHGAMVSNRETAAAARHWRADREAVELLHDTEKNFIRNLKNLNSF